jgi:hypothetical protein
MARLQWLNAPLYSRGPSAARDPCYPATRQHQKLRDPRRPPVSIPLTAPLRQQGARGLEGRPALMRTRRFIPEDEDVIVQPHPLSVAPLGQLLLLDASAENLRDSLGPLSSLPDEAIVMITDYCSAVTLARCSMVSRGLRIFCSSEELWRTRVIEELPEGTPLCYTGSWLQTYLQQTTSRPCGGARAPMGGRLFSDTLFTSWFCGTASIPRRWTQYENIERVDASALSVAEFASRFEEPGVPVILTGLASGWAASETWSHDALLRRFGQTTFNVGALQMRLDHFLEYSANCHDETPLYLFDKHFGAKAPELATEYVTPEYFAPERDLFAKLPPDCRPDYRWLVSRSRSPRAACRTRPTLPRAARHAPTFAPPAVRSSAAPARAPAGMSTLTRRRHGTPSSADPRSGSSRRPAGRRPASPRATTARRSPRPSRSTSGTASSTPAWRPPSCAARRPPCGRARRCCAKGRSSSCRAAGEIPTTALGPPPDPRPSLQPILQPSLPAPRTLQPTLHAPPARPWVRTIYLYKMHVLAPGGTRRSTWSPPSPSRKTTCPPRRRGTCCATSTPPPRAT